MTDLADRLRDSKIAVTVFLTVGLIAVLPLVGVGIIGTYGLGLIITMMILTLFATSFNLLFGYTGLLSFGHAAYFGAAAYVLGITLSGRLGFMPAALQSFLPAFVLAVAVAVILAFIFGVLSVQRGEIYFAMLTLAFSLMLYQLAYQWQSVTGGANGILISGPTIQLGGLSFNLLDTTTFYYLTLVLVGGSLVLLWRIVHSPYGQLLKAIRENPERAELIGVPVNRYQLSAFVIAGAFAGVAGTLFAVRNFIVTPGILHWSFSARPVLITLLGGPYSFFGPAIGAFMFVFLEEWLTSITEYWQIGLGLILIPIVLFAPGGLTGLVTGDTRNQFRSLFTRTDQDATDQVTDSHLEEDD